VTGRLPAYLFVTLWLVLTLCAWDVATYLSH